MNGLKSSYLFKGFEETYKKFKSLGATGNKAPYNVDGDLVTATVKDPFGNVIGLIYNPHFKIKE